MRVELLKRKGFQLSLSPLLLYSCSYITATTTLLEKEGGKPSVCQILDTLEYGPAPESPAVANAWLEDHGRSFGHFINNQWVKPSGRKTYDSINPATGEKLATTIQGAEVDQ